MTFSNIWKRIGKQPYGQMNRKQAFVFTDVGRYYITNLKHSGGIIEGFNAVHVDCGTCRYCDGDGSRCKECLGGMYTRWEYGGECK